MANLLYDWRGSITTSKYSDRSLNHDVKRNVVQIDLQRDRKQRNWSRTSIAYQIAIYSDLVLWWILDCGYIVWFCFTGWLALVAHFRAENSINMPKNFTESNLWLWVTLWLVVVSDLLHLSSALAKAIRLLYCVSGGRKKSGIQFRLRYTRPRNRVELCVLEEAIIDLSKMSSPVQVINKSLDIDGFDW